MSDTTDQILLPQSSGFGALAPLDAADALLLVLARRQLAAVALTPTHEGHRIRGERAGMTLEVAQVEGALGDAVAARLALLAGLDLAQATEQLGRLRIQQKGLQNQAGGEVEVLVALKNRPDGLSVEVRTLVAPEGPPPDPSSVHDPALLGGAGVIVGNYRIGEEIGKGGMGVVYKAEHVILDKPVAIKVLHSSVLSTTRVATRLIMEARAACRARHPAIVDVTDLGRMPDGRAYLVMELVPGPTLDKVLESGPLEAPRALGIALQIAMALESAHAAGVVHRDIKPMNVFLMDGDRVKVGDWGLAVVLGHDEAHGPSGTTAYRSPEQATGGRVDARTDLYSLGIVLFELLTGRIPVRADLLAACTEPVVGPEGRVDPFVEQIVWRALEPLPSHRQASAAVFRTELEAALQAHQQGGWRRWLPR